MAVADVLFLPWPSWAKLSFVLGGLLIIVSSIAGVTKVMKWRKLLRLEKECADKEKSGETTAMVATPVILPFGVRALDKDSIEGVWNARTATTLHGPRSKNSSPLIQPLRVMRKSKRETSVSSIPSLEIGEPSSAATPGPKTPPQTPPEITEAYQSRRKKANSITISYRGLYSQTQNAVEGPSNHQVQASTSTPKMKLRVSPTGKTNSRRFVIGGDNTSIAPNDHKDVIRRMEAHRRLHSAESGQLVPRVRPW